MPKMLSFSFIFHIKMDAQKFTNFDTFYKIYTDMTAVTI